MGSLAHVTGCSEAMASTERTVIDGPILTSVRVPCENVSWFAIQTWPRYEKKIAARLQEKGIEVFLPLVAERRQWSDRRSLVHMPLFPSYVFVRITQTPVARIPILGTNGVARFVGGRSTGVPIPDDQIESVRAILSSETPFWQHPFLEIGRRVRIMGGSLDGVQGILLAKNSDLSLVVSVQIIQRSVGIRIAGYNLEPA
jgi:transcription antitermination factor NusG